MLKHLGTGNGEKPLLLKRVTISARVWKNWRHGKGHHRRPTDRRMQPLSEAWCKAGMGWGKNCASPLFLLLPFDFLICLQ